MEEIDLGNSLQITKACVLVTWTSLQLIKVYIFKMKDTVAKYLERRRSG